MLVTEYEKMFSIEDIFSIYGKKYLFNIITILNCLEVFGFKLKGYALITYNARSKLEED